MIEHHDDLDTALELAGLMRAAEEKGRAGQHGEAFIEVAKDMVAAERATVKTMKAARLILKPLGITIKRTGFDDEIKVNFLGGKEATAAYTNDLTDAVGTGKAMAKWRAEREAK